MNVIAVFVWTSGPIDVDISVFEIELGINVAEDCLICLDNFLELNFNEVIEGVNMLFDKTLYSEKGRK